MSHPSRWRRRAEPATLGSPYLGDELLTLETASMVPAGGSWDELRAAAAGCTACPLHERGTQTVFGEGALDADLFVIGEQPGDNEDLEGRPFVGPAGAVLDAGMTAAGIDPARTYTTNVVKHFKWEPRGPRRIHQTPNRTEVVACTPWLDAELAIVEPQAVLLLGATAAKALLGSKFRVTQQRGQPIDSELAPLVWATVHPSSVLRAGDERPAAEAAFVDDLRGLAALL